MSFTIPDGSTVNYSGQWQGFGSQTFRNLSLSSTINQVAAFLTAAGFTVLNSSNDAGFAAIGLNTPYTVKLTLRMDNGTDVDSDNLLFVINDAVHNVTGNDQSQAYIADVTPPNGATVRTLTPAQQQSLAGSGAAKSGAHACGDPSWGFFDDPGQWISCLTSKGLSSLGLVFIGLAVGVVLLVTAQTKHRAGF